MDEETAHAELVSVLYMLPIEEIRDNDPNKRWLNLGLLYPQVAQLSDLALRLLGRYIANNTHLQRLLFSNNLMDVKVVQLFQELTKSSSIAVLSSFDPNVISLGNIGMNSVQSMIPFLENSPQLIIVSIKGNNSINTEGFEILVSTLHNRGIKRFFC